MDWIEVKYIGLLSGRFRNFTKKSAQLYNFSCPFCGDSSKDPRKARGYLFDRQNTTRFYCHKCNASMNFDTFLKRVDSQLHNEMLREKLGGERKQVDDNPARFATSVPKFDVDIDQLNRIPTLSQLEENHHARVYVKSRKIPSTWEKSLYYTSAFFEWANTIIPKKFGSDALRYDHGRLIIPLIGSDQKVHGFTARSFDPSSPTKYITLVTDPEMPKIFGAHQIDPTKRVLCFEGPIDAMFIPNSIAACGGDLVPLISHALGTDRFNIPKENIVLVFDNEPRHPHTIERMTKAIEAGFAVCFWPTSIQEKDVNEMVLAGKTAAYIEEVIYANTYQGLAAMAKLAQWKRLYVNSKSNSSYAASNQAS